MPSATSWSTYCLYTSLRSLWRYGPCGPPTSGPAARRQAGAERCAQCCQQRGSSSSGHSSHRRCSSSSSRPPPASCCPPQGCFCPSPQAGLTLVPLDAQPLEVGEHGLLALARAARRVRVLHPQHQLAAHVLGVQPVEERGARAAHVQVAGGRGRKADAHLAPRSVHARRRGRIHGRRGARLERVATPDAGGLQSRGCGCGGRA